MTKFGCLQLLTFLLVSPLWIRPVFMLCSEKKYQLLSTQYTLYPNVTKTYKKIEPTTMNKCGALCSETRFCQFWGYGKEKCYILHSVYDQVIVVKKTRTWGKIFFEIDKRDWTKIYCIKAGIGLNMSHSFLNKDPNINKTLIDKGLYFRSLVIDAWESLPIRMVKLSVFKGKVRKQLIFNGFNTTRTNWFSIKNLRHTTWTDMKEFLPYGKFQFGFTNNADILAEKKSGNCSETEGWLSIVSGQTGCPRDNQTSYPFIKFSNTNNAVKWSTGYEVADSMCVYVRIR